MLLLSPAARPVMAETIPTTLPQRIPHTLICVPTYNEVESIGELVRRIGEVAPQAEVLVVDDGSPDGTANLVREMMKSHPGLHLLDRGAKLGLGTAYLDAFRWGLERDYEYFFCMDADLSHRPEHLPNFFKLLTDSDVVVGSRYMPGGGVQNWGFHRVVLSRGANMLARSATGLKGADLTSGYRGLRRRVVQVLVNSDIRAEGYAFLVEVLFKAARSGFLMAQTPILFEDRRHGKSKLSKRIILEGALMLGRLAVGRLRGN